MNIIFPVLFLFFSLNAYAQHSVNDIKKYNGWYQVKIDVEQSGNTLYTVSQCYPSGDIYQVKDADKGKLPLYLKALCLGMTEQGLQNSIDFDDMSFGGDDLSMKLTGFSMTFTFNFKMPEEEINNLLGSELINTYKGKKW